LEYLLWRGWFIVTVVDAGGLGLRWRVRLVICRSGLGASSLVVIVADA
jgi:hypothetical protein